MDVVNTLKLRAFGLLKVPLIPLVKPRVLQLTDRQSKILIPFCRRNKNHLNSMFFGSMCVGADCTYGVLVIRAVESKGKKVSVIVKDFHATFFKRAEGDLELTCEDGAVIGDLIDLAFETKKRQETKVKVLARVPSKLGDEPVAEFQLTISVKPSKNP